MIALLQRVSQAAVVVEGHTVGAIERGLLVFVGVEKEDTRAQAQRLLQRILSYRVFPDEAGRMNVSLQENEGGLLLVPQFTLAADTRKGTRASFTPAADPEHGAGLFEYLLEQAREHHGQVESGRFGAYMKVSLTNDGPVTFWLRAN